MRIRAAFLLAIALAGALSTARAVVPTSHVIAREDAWREARALFDAERYGDALRVIGAALAHAPDDLDLLWLKAATLDRAGQSDRAISLYEHIVRMYPDVAPRLRTDYANALSHAGRTKEAAAVYRQVLAESPAEAEALHGFARMLNRQGQHRAAAGMYHALARAGADVAGDMAWTEYWSGRPDRARAEVARVTAVRSGDRGARRLSRLLDRDIGSGPTAGVHVASDNDGLDVTTFMLRQRVAAERGRTMLHIGVRQDEVSREGITLTLWRASAGVERIWSSTISTHAFADVLADGPSGVHRAFGNAWMTLRPAERVRIDVSGASDQIMTIAALGADVRMSTAAASADWQVTGAWSLGARGARSTFTDDNTQVRLTGETRLRLLRGGGWTASATGDMTTLASDHTPGTGYYSPEQYDEAAGGVLLSCEPWSAVAFSVHGRVGVLREDGGDTQSFGTYIARADGMLLPHVAVSAGLKGGDSNLSSPSGYSRTGAWAEAGLRF
jgi:hypothetical protein